jgi:Helix-turn-helix domain
VKRMPGQWWPLWKLAALLKVRREKLIELIDEGELVAYDLRGKDASRATIRIPPSAVIAWLEDSTISTVPARRRVLKILLAPSSSAIPARFTEHGAV